MRTATLVLVAYAVLVVLGAVWPGVGMLASFKPEIAAITAAYLGLTARRSLAGAVGASIVCGYLADLLNGVPVGLYALVAGLMCILGHLVHRRLLVRGWGLTIGFSFFVGVTTALLALLARAIGGASLAPALTELGWMVGSGVATAVMGPPLLRLMRRIDAAYARTHRERDAALEGLAP